MTERMRTIDPVGAQFEAPLTGATLTMIRNHLIVKPAGTIAALTINLPASVSDGEEASFNTTQIVTALTVQAAGTTVANPPTAGTAGGFAAFKFRTADLTWYRIG